tara:strand:- start:26 stop:934 length:909 start_codon:yes stop_codon:yes gene_type:complete
MAGKAIYSANADYSKTELQNLILESVSRNTDLLDGMFSVTPAGGTEDKKYKIDAYVGMHSIQIKMDYRSMVNDTSAVEFAQLDLETQNYKHGHFMKEPKAGGVSERALMGVDYLYYILPGEGIAIWEPAKLSRLVFHLMRSIPLDFDPQKIGFDGVALKGENAFKIAVAANKQGDDNYWNSLNYLLPNEYLMAVEGIPLGQWEMKEIWEEQDGRQVFLGEDAVFYANEDDIGERTYIKPERVIPWDEILYAIRTDINYTAIIDLVAEHILAYKYGPSKAYTIASHFDMNTDGLQLYDWSSHT